MNPRLKICGLTRPEEADMLNQAKADYAGFVLYEKSRRFVSIKQAQQIRKRLSPEIKAVAVTVSPNLELLEEIRQAEFDLIQIHGNLSLKVLEQTELPVWRACNLTDPKELKKLEQHNRIAGYVVDAKTAGSGRTFDWSKNKKALEEAKEKYFLGKTFILAGGLNDQNVREGIRLFQPDVVDVSSGVEGNHGKEEQRIILFAGRVREDESAE